MTDDRRRGLFDDEDDGDDLERLIEDRLKGRTDRIEQRMADRQDRRGQQAPRGTPAPPTRPAARRLSPEVVGLRGYEARISAPPQVALLRLRPAGPDAIECELLQGGGPAASGPELMPVDEDWLDAVCISRHLANTGELDREALLLTASAALTERFPQGILQRLAQVRVGMPVSLRVDAQLLDIPWEFLAIDAGNSLVPLATRNAVARVMTVDHAWPDQLPRTGRDRLSVLVLADPDCSLGDAGVDETIDLLRSELFPPLAGEVTYTIHQGPITRQFAVNELLTNASDVVFYMGHGVADPPGFKFAGEGTDSVLTADELESMRGRYNPPRIFFADACVSAAVPTGAHGPNPLGSIVAAMAQAGTTYVGTRWSIYGPAAAHFALGFLQAALSGMPLGYAMLSGHASYIENGGHEVVPCDNFAFCLYGDPLTTIELG